MSDDLILRVENLGVQVASASGAKPVLVDMNFELRAGEVLCLAGESGSGKSMTALAIMGLLPQPMARISSGRILLGCTDLVMLAEREMRKIRSARVAMIFQEPMTSLNPVMRIGDQLEEVLVEHGQASRTGAAAQALRLLEDVRLTSPGQRLRQYPHELSGGMRQRVMIAMALACDPQVLIADEPTTALDVTVQAEILDLIRSLQASHGTAVLMITHDMGVVAEMADRVIVMQAGRTVEQAPVKALFASPKAQYTRDLLAAVPRLGSVVQAEQAGEHAVPGSRTCLPGVDVAVNSAEFPPAASVKNLVVRFGQRGGLLNRVTREVHAVEQVSFSVAPGETLALVGESGSGKSTIGKAMLALVPFTGEVHIDGEPLVGQQTSSLRRLRQHVQMIFQDPYASLDPRMKVGDQVAEPLVVHGLAKGGELRERVAWLFERVGLSPDHLSRHPHEFSGGQRQRVCIARALALGPKIIVADECVSALDVSVQAQVLELLQELQREEGIAYLFISHDMAVVEQTSNRVAVLNAGQIVEIGSSEQVFGQPAHAYTQRLLSAVPYPDPERPRRPVADTLPPVADTVLAVGQQRLIEPLQHLGSGHYVAGAGLSASSAGNADAGRWKV